MNQISTSSCNELIRVRRSFTRMKKKIILIFILSLFFVLIIFPSHATELRLNDVPAQILFSPNGGCTKAIVNEINQAKTEILVQAYSFTSAPIAKALVDARKRGVKVQVILDKSQRSEKYTSATFLTNSGVPTYIDAKHAIAHNKIMIIDKTTVITGSFNFTKAAEEKNAENLLIVPSKDLAILYLENWQKHKEHSEEYRK
jgi:phosphatidylserine/phosphatidylglycerophosphate/cardiolipin synthase-like enzyme